MRFKVYLSDEGYGHLVRQRAIFDELSRNCPQVSATVQTSSYVEAARRIFQNADFVHRFNNISWPRKPNGSPDLEKISHFYDDYVERSDEFIRKEGDVSQYRFLISDFVYEVFPVARRNAIPAYGVAHFTWDWFFSKMYPIPLSMKVLKRLLDHAREAEVIYFPPFTPEEILEAYKEVARPVPLIVNQPRKLEGYQRPDTFTVLIMDSGASVLREHLEIVVRQLGAMRDIHFLVAEKYDIQADNVTFIPDSEFFSDYIPYVDLVVTRGGFNTISECVAYRTPILLLGEPLNPEIERNLLYLKQEELGSFISLDKFVGKFRETLYGFIEYEYHHIKRNMREHEIPTDGARVIALDILDRAS